MIRRLAILDTETTGIFGRDPWAEVIELAAVVLDTVTGADVHDAPFQSLVRPMDPHDPRSDEARAINKISVDDMLTAPSLIHVSADFLDWLYANEVDAVTSFNVAFDRAGLEKMRLRFLRWDECIMLAAMPAMAAAGNLRERRWFDVSTGVESIVPSLSLATCVSHYGIALDGDPHRALTDARAAADVWRHIHGRAA